MRSWFSELVVGGLVVDGLPDDGVSNGVSSNSRLGIVLTLSTGGGGDGKSNRDAARLRSSCVKAGSKQRAEVD